MRALGYTRRTAAKANLPDCVEQVELAEQGERLVLAGAVEFIDVREVLAAACDLFRLNQVGFSKIKNRKVVLHRGRLVGPGRFKLKSGNSSEKVDLAGGNTNAELRSRRGEIFLSDSDEGDAEEAEGLHESERILRRWFDPDVDVLGVARLRVMNDRIASRHHVADVTFVQTS